MLLAVTQPSYRLKSIFPGNQLFLLQLGIQTDQLRVILDTNEGGWRCINIWNSFHCSALKAGSSTEAHIPECTKKGIYTKHANNQPSWLCTYTKSSHEKDKIPPRAQVMSSSQAGMGGYSSSIPQLLLQIPNPEACSFMANWQLSISLRGCVTSQPNPFRFPSAVQMLARWGGRSVGAPYSAWRSRLWEPQGGCAWPKSPIHLMQVFPPC